MPKIVHKQLKKLKKHLTKHVCVVRKHAKDHLIPHAGNGHHPHVLKHRVLLGYTAIILLLKVLVVASYVAYPKLDLQASSINPPNILSMVNAARASVGLQPLVPNPQLARSASAKALDMAKNGYFAHTSPAGLTPWYWIKLSGYRYEKSAENLAVHYSTTEDVQSGWMASPSHRKQIMSPEFTETGIGVAQGVFEGVEATFVVEYFAVPIQDAIAQNQKPVATTTIAAAPVTEPQKIAPTPAPIVKPVVKTGSTTVQEAIPKVSKAIAEAIPVTNKTVQQVSLKPVAEGIEVRVTNPSASAVAASLGDKGTELTQTTSGTFVGTVKTAPIEANEAPKTLKISVYDGHGLMAQETASWVSGQHIPQAIFGIDQGQMEQAKLFNVFSAEDVKRFSSGAIAFLAVLLTAILALNIALKLHTHNIKAVVHAFSVIGLAFVLWAIN